MNKVMFTTIVIVGLRVSLFSGVVDNYGLACSKGSSASCYQLGISYRDGVGVGQNAVAAKQFFNIGCDMGDSQACSMLSDIDLHGTRSNIDTSKTISENLKYYTSARFGFTLNYPENKFVTKILSDNGDGITLYNTDQSLELKAYGSWYGDNIREIYRDELGWAKEAGQKVTYKVLKKNWFVLSGIDRKKQTIFYLKTYFKEGKSMSFRLEYPTRDKEKYNSLVSTISKNFKTE